MARFFRNGVEIDQDAMRIEEEAKVAAMSHKELVHEAISAIGASCQEYCYLPCGCSAMARRIEQEILPLMN